MADFNEYNIENRKENLLKAVLRFNKELYLSQLSLAGIITFIFILEALL